MPTLPSSMATTTPPALSASKDAAQKELVSTARDFEAAFLAEALGHMGVDATKGVEGAGPFSSFMNRAWADSLAARGGIGLSESIVRALAARGDV